MICVWVIVFRSQEGGRDWLGDVKATGINYITWRTMFNATEALDKYDLDMGAGKCKVRADN
jgi:hypothetical protein